jgi:thioesterase domain-containing protein
MAELYVKEIQTVQPVGPYLLGGYCMGGTIAIEMARQLREQGQEVAFVGALETYNFRNLNLKTTAETAHHYFQKIEFHLRNFLLLNSRQRMIFLRQKFNRAVQRRQVWYGQIKLLLGSRNSKDDTAGLVPARIWAANDDAAIKYSPTGIYPGRITHFVATKEYTCHCGSELQLDNLAQEVKSCRLDVYPAAMYMEPFVAQLAEQLRVAIDEALEEVISSNGGSNPEQREEIAVSAQGQFSDRGSLQYSQSNRSGF